MGLVDLSQTPAYRTGSLPDTYFALVHITTECITVSTQQRQKQKMAAASDARASRMKYMLVSGGVISGIGKGVISSSIGTIMKCSGVHVTSIKIDPYLNIGTQQVFV